MLATCWSVKAATKFQVTSPVLPQIVMSPTSGKPACDG